MAAFGRSASEKALEFIATQTADERPCGAAVVEGSPKAGIVNYARQHKIDLIILATHGRTGLPHIFMGSVAETVVRAAPCPVLIVRPEGHQFVMP
jgi:nucleotide-binding universal stress UspA family protein